MTKRSNRRRRPIPQYKAPQYADSAPQMPLPPYQMPLPPYQTPVAQVQVLQDKNASVAKINVHKIAWRQEEGPVPEYQFEASASAKREQGDRYDPKTGELLAVGRALEKAGRAMIREANHRVQTMVTEQHQAALNRMKPTKGQVRHRTLEEWERIQRDRRHEAAQAALAHSDEPVTSDHTWPLPLDGRPARSYAISGGRIVEVEDTRVLIRNSDGNVVVAFARE